MAVTVIELTARPELSEREAEVLYLVSCGMSNKAIAQHLFLSHSTIKGHLARISRKLGVGDRTGMAMTALRLQLIRW